MKYFLMYVNDTYVLYLLFSSNEIVIQLFYRYELRILCARVARDDKANYSNCLETVYAQCGKSCFEGKPSKGF